MALMRCSECGKEISDKAEQCPYCGCPVREIKKEKMQNHVKALKADKKRLYIIGGVAAIIIIAVIALCLFIKNKPMSEEELLIGNWKGRSLKTDATMVLKVYESKTLDYNIQLGSGTSSDVNDKKWKVEDGFLWIAEKDSDKFRKWFKIINLTEDEFEYKVYNSVKSESKWGHIKLKKQL